jgi:hypothetical protein
MGSALVKPTFKYYAISDSQPKAIRNGNNYENNIVDVDIDRSNTSSPNKIPIQENVSRVNLNADNNKKPVYTVGAGSENLMYGDKSAISHGQSASGVKMGMPQNDHKDFDGHDNQTVNKLGVVPYDPKAFSPRSGPPIGMIKKKSVPNLKHIDSPAAPSVKSKVKCYLPVITPAGCLITHNPNIFNHPFRSGVNRETVIPVITKDINEANNSSYSNIAIAGNIDTPINHNGMDSVTNVPEITPDSDAAIDPNHQNNNRDDQSISEAVGGDHNLKLTNTSDSKLNYGLCVTPSESHPAYGKYIYFVDMKGK